jgi:hypothetical protein
VKYSISIVLLTAFFFSACKKDKTLSQQQPQQIQYLAVQSDLFAMSWFRPGSYWVYRDSASARIDSIYVLGADSGNVLIGHQLCQWFSVRYHSTYYKRDFRQDAHSAPPTQTSIGHVGTISDPTTNLYTHVFNGTVELTDSSIFMKSPAWGTPPSSNPGYVWMQSDTQTFVLNSQLLKQVDKLYQKNNRLNGNVPATVFLKPGYGVLSVRVPDSSRVWNLVKYQVVQ